METRDTAEKPQDRFLAAEQRLLAEGLPFYLDAMMAIQELRQNVQKRCQRVLHDRLDEFAKALGMPLDATKIEDYSEPDGISELATTDWAWLGVKIPLQRAGTAYVTLVSKKEDRQIDADVGIELKDRDLFDRVWEIVRREEPRAVSGSRGIIEIYQPVSPDHIPSFVDTLSELMRGWSHLWQRVGIPVGSA